MISPKNIFSYVKEQLNKIDFYEHILSITYNLNAKEIFISNKKESYESRINFEFESDAMNFVVSI